MTDQYSIEKKGDEFVIFCDGKVIGSTICLDIALMAYYGPLLKKTLNTILLFLNKIKTSKKTKSELFIINSLILDIKSLLNECK